MPSATKAYAASDDRARATRASANGTAPPDGDRNGATAAPGHTLTTLRLVKVARALVRRHGYERLAVGEIWSRAELSHQTSYDHFADKRAVVCADHRKAPTC